MPIHFQPRMRALTPPHIPLVIGTIITLSVVLAEPMPRRVGLRMSTLPERPAHGCRCGPRVQGAEAACTGVVVVVRAGRPAAGTATPVGGRGRSAAQAATAPESAIGCGLCIVHLF